MTPSAPIARTLAAQAWVDVAEPLDLQLSPLGLRAMDALAPQLGETVIDVGCGAGQSSLQLAERVGAGGRVIGLDIAPLLLEVAKWRAVALPQLRFIEGDAQTIDLAPASADGLYSRFGVMAFTDADTAFANFRRALKPGGRLAFVCWRSLEENELDLLPLKAAGLEAMVDATPFSFADPAHIRAVLESAGFSGVTVEAHDEIVSSGGLDAMAEVLLAVGPLGRILRENPELRPAAEPRVRAALAVRDVGGRIALKAATWIVTARAGDELTK